ncbi:MAG: hypothetical protein LBS94_03370, partial [Prevotellaceae bacterium]|nr:hypothetical protein [Prevotellaceae bacterium]
MSKLLHPLPCLIFLLLIPAFAAAQKLSIGLFFDMPVKAVSMAVQGGSYAVIVNDTVLIADMGKGDEMQLRLQQGKLRL